MHLLYTVFLHLYYSAILLASLFNLKARKWINGRKKLLEKISGDLEGFRHQKKIWFHCASLGEFEQGRPLIEKYKKENPGDLIVLTFFSPSGYEIRKNYKEVDFVFYLPLDTIKNAKLFIEVVRPSIVFFIKYEFWFNFLRELKRNEIKLYLVSGIFRPGQIFFKPMGTWFKKGLQAFTYFFVQDEQSKKLLLNSGFQNVTVTGDTRFDRVQEVVAEKKSIPFLDEFKAGSRVLIAGSTWQTDEILISECTDHLKDFKLIIAAHEVNDKSLLSLQHLFSSRKTVLFSNLNSANARQAEVLLIDNVGYLSSLYRYGDIAYIGGGFGKGIHNILEPAAFGLPVIFGPRYQKFREAEDLLKLGAAYSISNKGELHKCLHNFSDPAFMMRASDLASSYVSEHAGACKKIMDFLNGSTEKNADQVYGKI